MVPGPVVHGEILCRKSSLEAQPNLQARMPGTKDINANVL